MIKKNENLFAEFKKIHMQEINLYMKFFENKVKNNLAITEDEINEAMFAIREKLMKIMELGGKNENNVAEDL